MNTSPDLNSHAKASNRRVLDMGLSQDEIDRVRELSVSVRFTETVEKLVAAEIELNFTPTETELRIISTDIPSEGHELK